MHKIIQTTHVTRLVTFALIIFTVAIAYECCFVYYKLQVSFLHNQEISLMIAYRSSLTLVKSLKLLIN